MKPRLARDWAYPPLIACAAMCFIDRPWPWVLPLMFIAGIRGVQWALEDARQAEQARIAAGLPPLPERRPARLPEVVYVPEKWVADYHRDGS